MLLDPNSIQLSAQYSATGFDLIIALGLLVLATIIILDGRKRS